MLEGVIPIVHTPFAGDDSIDVSILRREVDWAYAQGAHGIAIGMVSEFTRLTHDERLALTECLVEFSAGRGGVVASAGAESLRQAVEYAVSAERFGCQAVMATPPLTTHLSGEQQFEYFRQLARSISLPLIAQDASAYVGQPISIDVYARLIDEFGPEKILFKPEGAPVGPTVSELRDITRGAARVFDGSGGMLLVDCYRRGIVGTMPGMEVLDGIVAIWRALESGDEATAYRIYFPVSALVALQMQAGLDGFLAVEKYLLVRRGVFDSDRRRKPNSWKLDDETAREVDRLFDQVILAVS